MKKILVLVLLAFILLPNVIFAEEVKETSKPEIRPFRNLGNYFKTFVDFDSNIRYLTDDLLITNQCKKRDIFAIHTRNDEISKKLIEEFTTLDQITLDELKLEYATLNLELKFLRRINLLNEENGQNLLREYLERKAKRDYKSLATKSFPIFLAKYSESLKEYAECRNSWFEIAEKVESIKNNATQISTEWRNLKDTLKSLKETVIATPRGFYENSLRDGLAAGIQDSATSTWENLRREATEITTQLERLVLNPQNATFQVLRSIEGRRQMTVEEIIANENSLFAIVETVRNQEVTEDLNNDLQMLQAELSVSNNFNDNANMALLSNLLIANAAIQETTNTFKAQDVGLNAQAKEIYRMQCR